MTSIAELRPFRLCSATPPRKAQSAHSTPCCWRPNIAAREEEEGHCFAHSKLCNWRLNVPGSVRRRAWRWDDEEIVAESQATFAEGVTLFNAGEYYECHDVLEGLWNNAPEPQRSILHGILQCAVGLYHLLNQNHRGAMVELGEGLTKLRRADFQQGPLHDFEREASALLEFVYNAQLEHAACVDDVCTRMDGSEQSYQLLGDFGAGKPLYRLSVHKDTNEVHIEYFKQRSDMSTLDPDLQLPPPITVKVPVLRASEEDLYCTL